MPHQHNITACTSQFQNTVQWVKFQVGTTWWYIYWNGTAWVTPTKTDPGTDPDVCVWMNCITGEIMPGDTIWANGVQLGYKDAAGKLRCGAA